MSTQVRIYGNLVDANIANGIRSLRVKGGGSDGGGGGGVDVFQLDPELVRLCASVCHQLLARDSIQLNFNRMFDRVFNRVHYTLYG